MLNIFFDCETTGLVRSNVLGVGDQVAQIGGMICDDNFIPLRVFMYFCDNLKAEVCEEAQKVNGLSMEEIRKYIPDVFLSQVLKEKLPEFFEDDVRFFGYNTNFDMSMVDATIYDSGVNVDWGKAVVNVLPTKGHSNVDVAQYCRVGSSYKKLEKIINVNSEIFREFYAGISDIDFDCNVPELIKDLGMHCSYIDSICTYLVWMRDVWKTRVF